MIRPASDRAFYTQLIVPVMGSDTFLVQTRLVAQVATELLVGAFLGKDAMDQARALHRALHMEKLLVSLRLDVGAKAWGEVDDAVARGAGDLSPALDEAAHRLSQQAGVSWGVARHAVLVGRDAYRKTLHEREVERAT
jgi:hypothetical protein